MTLRKAIESLVEELELASVLDGCDDFSAGRAYQCEDIALELRQILEQTDNDEEEDEQ